MQLDGTLVFAKLCPWEQRQAQIDNGCIQGLVPFPVIEFRDFS